MFDPVLSPQQKILARRLCDLATRVRWPKNRQLIWQRLLTSQQRELVEAREDVGPDIVDIWAQLYGIHPLRAVLNLAYEIEAILPKEYARLVEDVEAELASKDDLVVSTASRDGSVLKKTSVGTLASSSAPNCWVRPRTKLPMAWRFMFGDVIKSISPEVRFEDGASG